jgi:hypothetical protein
VTQVAEAAAAEARWQSGAAADRERQVAGQLAAAQLAQRRAEQQLGELQASIEHVRFDARCTSLDAASDIVLLLCCAQGGMIRVRHVHKAITTLQDHSEAASALQTALADAVAAGAELQRAQQQLRCCRDEAQNARSAGINAQQAADLAVEAAAAARQHDDAAAISASHAHKQASRTSWGRC